jgi:hypothetical protein
LALERGRLAKVTERREKFREHEKVGDGVGTTTLGNFFRRRQLPPVRLTDEDDPAIGSGAQPMRLLTLTLTLTLTVTGAREGPELPKYPTG